MENSELDKYQPVAEKKVCRTCGRCPFCENKGYYPYHPYLGNRWIPQPYQYPGGPWC